MVILIGFMVLFNCCKQNNSNQISESTQIMQQKDSTIFEKYDSWLSEIKLPKSKKIFIDILQKIHELERDSCKEETLEGLSNKTEFQRIIQEFKFFPYEDKYIFIRGLNTWSSQNIGTIYALVDRKDSIVSFKYDCLNHELYTGGGYLDTIYLSDWNKNGSLDLIYNDFSRCSGLKNYDAYIYDLKISENKFNLLFSYNNSGNSKTGMDRIHEVWRDSIRFIDPYTIEKISFDSFIVDTIKREDYEDEDSYKRKLASQNSWLNESGRRENLNSIKKTLYKFDKKSKSFKSKDE